MRNVIQSRISTVLSTNHEGLAGWQIQTTFKLLLTDILPSDQPTIGGNHGAYIRWYLRTSYARMQKNLHYIFDFNNIYFNFSLFIFSIFLKAYISYCTYVIWYLIFASSSFFVQISNCIYTKTVNKFNLMLFSTLLLGNHMKTSSF